MDEVINNLEQRNADMSVAIAQQMNEYNAQNTINYEEKLQNLFNL